MKYKEGDVLIDEDGDKRKVLGVCGLAYLVSAMNLLDYCDEWFTEKELDEAGYTLDDQEAELNFLIDETEKKLEELYRQHRENGGEG